MGNDICRLGTRHLSDGRKIAENEFLGYLKEIVL
jgi:hypothetical protein